MTNASTTEIKHRVTGEVLHIHDGSDLREADLRGADLRGADLREADLRGADLDEAYLRGASLGRADLNGAKLSGARVSPRTGMVDADATAVAD